ncbi:phage infection protein [Pseudomonas sp. E102]|uniref:phage infection protein n=1 Tax=Pseudomonas sp. E102 TaxID=181579 RepID=UPI0040457368
MINFSKFSSLAIALTLVGGAGLSNIAAAESAPSFYEQAAHQLAEGGSDRLIENRVAEGGSDRLIENRMAEGGADRLQELRERSPV